MVVVSLVAHAALITAFAFVPAVETQPAENVARAMMISLGGAPGPVQGRNPISARPIQEAVPETVKPTTDAPPALAKPEMVEPVKTAKAPPKATAKPEPQKDAPQLHGSKPTQGAEVKAGTAKVETHGAAIPFGGLATGGGGAGAGVHRLRRLLLPRVPRRRWCSWFRELAGRSRGRTDVQVEVHDPARRHDHRTSKSSSRANQFLNLASQRALVTTKQLPPLPAAFTREHLTVHLVFQYQTMMMNEPRSSCVATAARRDVSLDPRWRSSRPRRSRRRRSSRPK